MDTLGSFLDTGDKVASIVGAVAGLAALWIAVRAGTRLRRRPDRRIVALLAAQLAGGGRHRYRFFGEHVPALTDLYVRSRASLGGPSAGDKPRTVQATEILTEHRHAVLLGDAGAGKSSFLTTVAGDLARRRRGDVAVVVPATDLVGRRLPEALSRAVQRDLAVDLPAEVFERAPGAGRSWRVLLDGLDEVVAAPDRSDVLWQIKGLLAGTGPYRFVVTCRPLAAPELAELHGPSVGVYDLRPFDRRELDEFAHRWFAARFPDDRRRADRTAGRFLARVAGARLGPVARVPLLATIAALVYESADDRALPSSRAALYDRFVDHLLDGRGSLDRFREATLTSGSTVAEWLCSDIRGHVGGLLRACGDAWFTDSDVRLTEVAAAWMEANAPHGLGPEPERFLRDLLLTTGVCTMRRDRVVFAHQSFAEYFAASEFDVEAWVATGAEPATRSIAAFAIARRPDADELIARLLADGEPDAAGDLLADGIPVRPETRDRIVDTLVWQVAYEGDVAPEALRILGELSIDAGVLARMTTIVKDSDVSAWTRALVADRIADIDPAAGFQLLHMVAGSADEVVRAWIADTLDERGGRPDSYMRLPLWDDGVPAPQRPLGELARQALTRRLADARATESERVAAARQLALGGDLTPLRAMASAADVDPHRRVELATALADAGDPSLLRRIGAGAASDSNSQTAYAAARVLFGRRDPAALASLRLIAETYRDRPMAYGAAARCVDLGDREPLTRLAREPGEDHVRLAAARRLAALGEPEALEWLLAHPQPPALEAATLAGLLEAGRAEMAPRLERLLEKHRFRRYRQIELRYLLAANGRERSAGILRRWSTRRRGSHVAVEAAIALTALGDPQGPELLRRTAADGRVRQRSRMRAAVGLAQLVPDDGMEWLERLAEPGSRPALRLRAATVALGIGDRTEPLTELALDPGAPAAQRAAAVELMADRGDPRVAALAADRGVPALVRAAAAPMLPETEARAALSEIATGPAGAATRVAAIDKLDALDGQAAGELFGRLLRDRRIGRFRRWWLAIDRSELLSGPDSRVLAERVDEDGSMPRVFLDIAVLAVRRPERVFAPQDGTAG